MRERYPAHAVFIREIRGELAEEEIDVVLAVAQGGHTDLDGVEAVVKVLAEPALADCVQEIDVGRGHDADVGLLDLRGTDLHILAVLQHTEQHHLRAHRQLADLVEEERTAVRLLEIPLAGLCGAGERALLVSEKLGVDGAFGNASAVDCEKLAVAPGAVLMDDARDVFLAYAALARHQHRQVRGGHRDGGLQGPVQRGVVADDVVSVLESL